MNIQNNAMYDIATNLAAHIRIATSSAVKRVKTAWPDQKWLQVDGGLPAVAIMDIGEKTGYATSQFEVQSQIVMPGPGASRLVYEKQRRRISVQMTLFCGDPDEREVLGELITQYFIANNRIPITNYKLNPPALSATGESLLIFYRGGHTELEGEANFWPLHLTWEIQSRVLDAVAATQVAQINLTQKVQLSPDVPAPAPSGSTITFTETSSVDAKGNPILHIMIT